MSEWDKMIARICGLSKDLRFDELRKVYVEMVRQVIEREEKKHENVERLYENVLSYGDCRRSG